MGREGRAATWSGGKRSVRADADTTPTNDVVTQQNTAGEEQAAEPLATDAAKKLAAEHGIDLATVTGTGAEGRVTRDDVAALLPSDG